MQQSHSKITKSGIHDVLTPSLSDPKHLHFLSPEAIYAQIDGTFIDDPDHPEYSSRICLHYYFVCHHSKVYKSR
jgi:hypothetical protein